MTVLFTLPIVLRVVLLPQSPVPIPSGADDFSYLLLGDTLAHLRLANPPHPLHQFFESVFTLQRPAYASIYPLGQGFVLAFGQLVLHNPWAGVVLSSGCLCALSYWMLKAWVPSVFAFAGGLLCVVQFGPLSPWVNSYWGGLVSATAGCLVFGSLPRLRKSPEIRYGLPLGLGFAFQLLSRPFETVFLAAAAGVYVLIAFRGSLQSVARPALTAVAVASAALMLLLLQNKAVTHQWTTMPYMLSRYQYGVPTTFTFQQNPIPHNDLTGEQELDYKAQAAIHGPAIDSLTSYLQRLLYRLRFLRFFLLAPLYIAVILPFRRLNQWQYLWARRTILLFALGTNFYPYFFPQYIAALTCLFLLVALWGLQSLSGKARTYILAVCAASFAFWFGVFLSGSEDLLPIAGYQSWYYLNRGDPQFRAWVDRQLGQSVGQQLVFVRYSPRHRFEEWIHNAADIDSSRVVWAGDLGPVENLKLIDYYPQRNVWLLEPDVNPPALTPYPRESGPFLTVH